MVQPAAMDMYFIAIVLPEALNRKVQHYKTMMKEKYGCTVALKSPAHITLLPPCWMDPTFEESLKNDLDLLASGMSPFEICTADFSSFSPRTLFIATTPSGPLNRLKQKTGEFFSSRQHYKLKTDDRPFHPHITIATRDLHKKDFHEAWLFFESNTFRECWTAGGISLLKHNKKNWDVVHTSQFKYHALNG